MANDAAAITQPMVNLQAAEEPRRGGVGVRGCHGGMVDVLVGHVGL